MVKEHIQKYFYNGAGKVISARWNQHWHIKNNLEEQWKSLFEVTSFLDTFDVTLKERIAYILNDVYKPNMCLECGSYAGWMYDKGLPYVKTYCSQKCSRHSKHKAEKIRQTYATKVDLEAAKEKRRNTNLERHGYEHSTQIPAVRAANSRKNLKNKNTPERLALLDNLNGIIEDYIAGKPTTAIAEEIGIDRISIVNRLKNAGVRIRGSNGNRSWAEKELFNFVSSHDKTFKHSQHILPENREVDMYSEELKLGFEFNGLFWHSSRNREDEINKKYFHVKKTDDANRLGIDLYHIDSYLWEYKRDIVESYILNKLGKTPNTVYARKCDIVELNGAQSKEFFDDNHFQGYTQSSVTYGLIYKNNIVAAMSFGKPRFSKKYNWELTRFANTKYTNVVGGASRLFKHFLNNSEGTIITYADLMVSKGKLYNQLGFEHTHTTRPGYMWTNGTVLYNRTMFMKKHLALKLKIFNEELSESDNMYANRYRKYFNCGNMVFVYSR